MAAPPGARARSPRRGLPSWVATYVALGALLAAVGGILAYSYGVAKPAPTCDGLPATSLLEVHGVALDASDPGVVYVATKKGLVRGENDTAWSQVGVCDDIVGFAAHPTQGGVLWRSGHVAGGYQTRFGIDRSDDGGASWEHLGLKGRDFHALAVDPANPDRLYAFEEGGFFHRSDDAGRSWSEVRREMPGGIVTSLAVNRTGVIHAATPIGILTSADGVEWATLRAGHWSALAIDARDERSLLVGARGGIERSIDGGASWSRLGLDVGLDVVGSLALHPAAPGVLYAGTYLGALYKTTDAGATWTLLLPAFEA